jgi:hypothetical protein
MDLKTRTLSESPIALWGFFFFIAAIDTITRFY